MIRVAVAFLVLCGLVALMSASRTQTAQTGLSPEPVSHDEGRVLAADAPPAIQSTQAEDAGSG